MIRGDLLRIKSAQVTAVHKQELASLGEIRDRQVHARDRVGIREERFWKEIARASSSRGQGSGGGSIGKGPALARAIEAHRLLQQAKDEHSGITTQFQKQLARVLRAKTSVTAFTKLQLKERRQVESQRAERQGEEVAEIGISAKLHDAHRYSVARREVQEADSRLKNGVEESTACCDPQKVSFMMPPGGIPMVVSPPSMIAERDGSARVESSPPLAARIAVHAATVTNSEHGNSLHVQVESRGVPLTCSIASESSGRVGVIVEAPLGKLSRQLENERGALAVKLNQLGIKVGSIEVRHGVDVGTSLGGYSRRGRRALEEQDENTIA